MLNATRGGSGFVKNAAGPSPTINNKMILNFEVTGALAIAGGTTKYCTVNGYCEVATDLTSFDPSLLTENAVYQAFVVPVAGTVSKAFYYGNIPASSQHHIATMMKNGVATSIVLDVVSGDDDGNGNAKLADNTHTVSVVAGDLLSWKLAAGAGANTMVPGISALFTPA